MDVTANGGDPLFTAMGEVAFEAIPEPLTILGAGAAIGFGTAFKRKLAKKEVKRG